MVGVQLDSGGQSGGANGMVDGNADAMQSDADHPASAVETNAPAYMDDSVNEEPELDLASL